MQHVEVLVPGGAPASSSSRWWRHAVADARVEAQRRGQTASSFGGLVCESPLANKRHVVAVLDQCFGEIGHDALRAAIELRGDAS